MVILLSNGMKMGNKVETLFLKSTLFFFSEKMGNKKLICKRCVNVGELRITFVVNNY